MLLLDHGYSFFELNQPPPLSPGGQLLAENGSVVALRTSEAVERPSGAMGTWNRRHGPLWALVPATCPFGEEPAGNHGERG